MGIVSGFLSGAGKATAEAGKMMFADKIAKEREEANFLRDSALKKTITAEDREFKSSEAEKRDVAAMERTKYTADIKAKTASGADKPTTQMRNAAALRKKGYPPKVADGLAHGGFREVKDEDTGDMVTYNILSDKPLGRLTTVGNKKEWVPEGKEVEQPITNRELKIKAAEMSEAEGKTSDYIPFNEYKAKDPKVRAALEEERAGKKGGGIIGDKMPKAPGKEIKTIGNKQLSKQEYIDAMVKKYGKDKLSIIEKQWSTYK